MHPVLLCCLRGLGGAVVVLAQTSPAAVPPPGPEVAFPNRPRFAPTAREWVRTVEKLDQELPADAPHDLGVQGQVMAGNVPGFLRRLCPVNVTNVTDGQTNVGRFFVTPDYLAIGSDEDYLFAPIPPKTAQFLADQFLCCLPTPKMVDAIYATAIVKLPPRPIPPSPAMTTIPVFRQHNEIIKTQRVALLKEHPLGTLVAGHKKDVVISIRLAGLTNRVAIYGWHQTNGVPIQPLYTGHTDAWVDYSHGIRLVYHAMEVNGQPTTVARVLADPNLCGLLSNEGVVTNARYGSFSHPLPFFSDDWTLGRQFPADFWPGPAFGELSLEVNLRNQVRIRVNAPALSDFSPDKPVLLIFYALPNGNTIEQTLGKRPEPGDDWHYDIQHIGAQTRWLRQVLTNRTVVIACLEARTRSWPAWRQAIGDQAIPEILAGIKGLFGRYQVETVLTGHSGGGSLTFGYLNTVEEIPDDVVRLAFLDSNYAYDSGRHAVKLIHWLSRSSGHALCVLAYQDYVALLDGKTFVSENGGTWGRSQRMLSDLGREFPFTVRELGPGLAQHGALDGRIQFLLKANPEKKIYHTVQVERNGLIHALLSGTPLEGRGYEYFGPRVYERWITD